MTRIHSSAIVESGAELASDVEVGAFCVVGPNVRLADGVKLHAHAVVTGHTQIGARTVVHSHAVLGGSPQYRGETGSSGKLVIGSDTILREYVSISVGSSKGSGVGSSRVDLQACKLEYSIVSPK